MNKRLLYTFYLTLSVFCSTICVDKKNNFIKPALNLLHQCMKQEHNQANLPKLFNKKLAELLAKKNINELIELLSEAETFGNIYIINGVISIIAERLECPVSGQELAFLHEKLSSFSYALLLEDIKLDNDEHNHHHNHHRTRACTGTPISIAEYISLNDVPILYLGNIGILLFNDKNISSLNGMQDISQADIAITIFSDNCIAGYNDDPDFPTDPFQGMPNAYYFIADNNLIESLPATFFNSAPTMQEIFLGNNLLTALPEGLFSNLDQLGVLELSYNMLTTVTTTDILNLAALNILFLDNNSLVDISSDLIDGNPNLRYLYLNNNALASWPSTALNNVVDSMYLDLSYNNLTDFEPESITDGTEIVLTGNPLTTSQQDFLAASFPNVYFIF